LIKQRLRIHLHKLFIKKGFGLKSYKILTQIISRLKNNNAFDPFKSIGQAVIKILPFCVVKKVTRGKHKIVLLLPIQYNKAFRVALNLLKNNSFDDKKSKNKKKYFLNFTSEVLSTINKKSKSYKTKLLHLKDIRFALSFR